MDALLQLIEQTDDLLEFFVQCPAGKRGRPLSVAKAQEIEKSQPGSVCAKVAQSRRGGGPGERTVFYRMKTYGDTLKERMEKERIKRERQASGAFEPPKGKGQSNEASFPVLWKGLRGTSEKQVGYAQKLVKDFRNSIRNLAGSNSQNGGYFTEAWRNLHRIEKANDIIERNGLDDKHLVLTLLSPQSAKVMARAMGINIAKNFPPNFARIMDRFFKNDEEYHIAKEKAIEGKKESGPNPPVVKSPSIPHKTDNPFASQSAKQQELEIQNMAVEEIGRLVEEAEKKKGFFGRLWGRTKEKTKEITKKAIEELWKTQFGKRWQEIIRKRKAGEKYKFAMAKEIAQDLWAIKSALPL